METFELPPSSPRRSRPGSAASTSSGGGTPRADRTLSAAECEDHAASMRLEEVQHLAVRDLGLTRLQSTAAQRLQCLVALSLSHNKLASLDSLAPLRALEELNVNFNRVGTLAVRRAGGGGGGAWPKLRKLYASNNRLPSLVGAEQWSSTLEVLCAFRNRVADLAPAIDLLRSFSKLRELDLDGNPCAHGDG